MATLLDCPIPEQTWLREATRSNGRSATPARLPGANGNQREVPDAGPWEPAIAKLLEFQHLGANWDGLGAVAPSRELLASAIGLAYTLHELGVAPPSCVVPGVEGFVDFECQLPDGTFGDIEIDRSFHAEVMVIEPGQPAKHWTLPTE